MFRFAFLALFALCYGGVVTTLVHQWTSNTMYSYAFAVPIISAYMVWHRSRELKQIEPIPDYWLGASLTTAGLAMLVLGRLGALMAVQELSLIVTLAGLVFLLFGRAVVRRLWVPIGYLLFMIPIWDVPIERLHAPSQALSAKIAVGLLHLAGVPALLQNTFIVLPTLTLEVARECSGVNQLIAVVALALPAAYLLLNSYARGLVLLIFSVAVATLSNGVRIALIGVLCYHGWQTTADIHGPYHILQGLAVSVVGYVVIFVGLSFLSSGKRGDPPSLSTMRSGDPRTFAGVRRPWVEIVLASFLVLAGGYRALFHPEAIPLRHDLRTLPDSIADWTTDTLVQPVGERFSGVDDELVRVYRSPSGEHVRLYVGYHRYQAQGKELVDDANAALNAAGSPVLVPMGSNEAVELHQFVRQRAGSTTQVVYWYDMNGRITANKYAAKAYMIWDAITRRRTNGAVVMVDCERPASLKTDGLQPREIGFVQALLPLLRDYIPS